MTHCYSSANSKGEYIAAQSQSTSISRRPITGPGGWSAEILLIFDENVTLPAPFCKWKFANMQSTVHRFFHHFMVFPPPPFSGASGAVLSFACLVIFIAIAGNITSFAYNSIPFPNYRWKLSQLGFP